MEQEAIVKDLEARAKAAGLSMSELCKLADVWPGTVSRWKPSEKNPEPIGITFKTLSKLNAALAQQQTRDAAA